MDVKHSIDINCDMGEGFAQDEILFPLISSCNIACGAHAGDADTMKRTLELALRNNVQIGAHPSYPDRANFGRKKMEISHLRLFESIAEQYQNLCELARQVGADVAYLKPHGALYNVLNKEAELAELCLPFLRNLGVSKILGLPNSILRELSSTTDLTYIAEGFADRGYTADGHLVARSEANALIGDTEQSTRQVRQMIVEQQVKGVTGTLVAMEVQTICIHSDTPSAFEIASALNKMFAEENVERRQF